MLALLATLLFQTTSVAPAPAAVHDADLKLTYYVPAGYKIENEIVKDAVQAEKDKQTGVMKAAVGCISVPTTAMDVRTDFRLVAMIKLDTKCLGEPAKPEDLGTLATSALRESLNRLGTAQMLPSAPTTIGTHVGAFVQGSSVSEKLGVTLQGAAVCTLSSFYVVCWEFVAISPEALRELSASTVQFDGEAAALPLLTLPGPVVTPAK